MFERRKINKAATRAITSAGLRDDESEYLIHAVRYSPMMPAAVAGLQQDFLSGPYVATAYLLAAIIDATKRTDDLDNLHRGEVAMKAAISAMLLDGATNDETLATVEELVAMHRRSAEKLERAVLHEHGH